MRQDGLILNTPSTLSRNVAITLRWKVQGGCETDSGFISIAVIPCLNWVVQWKDCWYRRIQTCGFQIQSCPVLLRLFSCVWLFAIPWTIGCQALLSKGFSRQKYWSGSPYPSPEDLPDPRVEPKSLMSPALQAGSLPLMPPSYVHVALSLNFFEPQFPHL